MLKPLWKQTKHSQRKLRAENLSTFIFGYEKGTSIKTQDLCHPRQKGMIPFSIYDKRKSLSSTGESSWIDLGEDFISLKQKNE